MGVALLGKSFLRLTSVNPGYDPRNVLTLGVTFMESDTGNPKPSSLLPSQCWAGCA